MRISTILTAAAVLACAAAPALADPAHYDIKQSLDLKAQTLKADVTITLPPQDVGVETAFVLGDWIKVEHVDGGPGAKVRIEPTDKPFKGLTKYSFTFAHAPTRPVVLHFRYSGAMHAPSEKPLIDPKEGLELGFEEAVTPVRPNFSLLFTVDADIRGIPADEVVVGQGQIRHEGDRVIIHRSFEDLDMPFAALSGLQKEVEPQVEVYARHPDGVLESAYRKYAGTIVAFYSKLYGPLDADSLPARLVVLPRQGAAYERRAYISVPDGADELAKMGHVDEWLLTNTVSHEFSHGWWWRADPLTEDHWLNESLAEYSSLRFTEATFGQDQLKIRLDHKIEPAKTGGPVIGHGRPSKYALYDRGPLLLYDLDHKIGRAKMDEFLGIIGRHPPKTTAEFLKTLSQVAGDQAAKDFETALRAP